MGHTHEDVDQKFSVISRVSPSPMLPEVLYGDKCEPCFLLSCVPQRLKSADIITPREFEWAVLGAFLDIGRDADHKVGEALLRPVLHSFLSISGWCDNP